MAASTSKKGTNPVLAPGPRTNGSIARKGESSNVIPLGPVKLTVIPVRVNVVNPVFVMLAINGALPPWDTVTTGFITTRVALALAAAGVIASTASATSASESCLAFRFILIFSSKSVFLSRDSDSSGTGERATGIGASQAQRGCHAGSHVVKIDASYCAGRHVAS